MPDLTGWFNIGSFFLQLPALAIAQKSISKSNDDLQSQSLADLAGYMKEMGEFQCFLEEDEVKWWNIRYKSCFISLEKASVEPAFPFNWLPRSKLFAASEQARKLRVDFKSRSLYVQAQLKGMYQDASASEINLLAEHQNRRIGIAFDSNTVDDADTRTLAGVDPPIQLQDLVPAGVREPV